MTTTNIQKNINDKIFDDIISYLQEQCKFYTRIINNDEELFKEINNLKNNNTMFNILFNRYNTKNEPVNLLRYSILKAIEKNITITNEFVNDVKNKFINKDIEFFKNKLKLNDNQLSFIKEYTAKKGGNTFHNWTKNFSIFYTFFYSPQEQKKVKEYLNKIGNFLLAELNISQNYQIKTMDFNGTQNYGINHIGIALYPIKLRKYTNAIQLIFEINYDKLSAGIHVGKDIENKFIQNNQEKACKNFNEVITELKKQLDTVSMLNKEIIEKHFSNTIIYTEEDFFNEVFLDKNQYNTLKNLLLNKMNIILEGAPGVGKTYAAKRLAYSILGKKDKNKIKMIQFHQSYGYEDFIMGYRPNENGFELVYGSFYKFCKMAEEDSDNKYFWLLTIIFFEIMVNNNEIQ